MTLDIIDPSDVDPTSAIYADWGVHLPEPAGVAISPIKKIGITIVDYTTRFINPITGIPKTAMSTQQSYYIGYIVMAVAIGAVAYWVHKRG